MSSLTEIRQAIGLTIKNFSEQPIEIHDTVDTVNSFPAAIIEPDQTDFEVAMQRGSDDCRLVVYVLCSGADLESAQKLLDQFVTGSGPSSIRQIIYDHDDLGLDDCDASVTAMRGYGGTYESGAIKAVGAILHVRVITDGR